ncbi:MAG TPA: hypothetical protein VHZ99_14030 [Steroidobacteraceae bacterium]|jgi:hypothetical protein|nr:hypothetical protein [Steroidobacteraceae bacterium]
MNTLMRRHQFVAARLAASALVLVLTACAHTESKVAPPERQLSNKDPRAQLSIGYSLLYQEANGIPKLDWLLMFKEKTSEMARMTHDLVDYYKQLADRLQTLSKEYPAMRIDIDPMSKIEADTRKAIGTDQAKDFAPVVGKSGIDFEREALLMFYDALNEQRHLVGVMIEQEPSSNLKKFLENTKAELDERHEKVGALLSRRYFTHAD